MGKRKRSTSPLDRITEDEILCSIISSLPLRDAVRSCVLSRRWRHIWTLLPNLIFDAANILHPRTLHKFHQKSLLTDDEKDELLIEKTDKFIHSVYSVLKQCRGARVKEFTIEFSLHKSHSRHLDKWVRTVVALKTKKFDLNLVEPSFSSLERVTKPYDFNLQLLGSSSIEELFLQRCSLRPPFKFDGLNHLKELNLEDIDVTEENISRLLSNTSNLERLTVESIDELVTLIIPHTLSRLQYLEVDHCYELEKIDISAVNLNELNYLGVPVDFTVRHSLQLKEAVIMFTDENEGSGRNLDFYLTMLCRNMPHLETLSLGIPFVSKVADLPKGSYSFIYLTSLNWEWNIYSKTVLLWLAAILDAAPVLEELILHVADLPKGSYSFIYLTSLNWEWNICSKTVLLWLAAILDAAPVLEELILHLRKPRVKRRPQKLRKSRKILHKCPHTHLKTIEIHGICFDKWHIKIAQYLLNNLTELESMRIEACSDFFKNAPETYLKNFREDVPTNVRLEISLEEDPETLLEDLLEDDLSHKIL